MARACSLDMPAADLLRHLAVIAALNAPLATWVVVAWRAHRRDTGGTTTR